MNNILQSLKKMVNLQNKTTLVAGAVAASVGGYYVASQLQSIPQGGLTPQTTQTTTITSAGNSEEQCKAQNMPSFINQSAVWPGANNTSIIEAFQKLSPPSVIVTAAGNHHPAPVAPTTVEMSRQANAIVVGSIAPDGKRSYFSAEHEEVHILAPSDIYITSADDDGNTRRFSGTSGATPLVTGSLAGFEWMADYHPTAAEAKTLLEKTAIPTLMANQDPRLNGVGMVNAYKLGMVGEKLKEACGTDTDCFQRKINEDETYEFEIDKQSILANMEEAFPQCSQTMCKSESGLACPNKETIFNELREAAFLNPDDKDLWRAVGCVYEVNNFSKNAAGVMSIYRALFNATRESFVDISCTQDSDCVYVPNCNSLEETGELIYNVANKDFQVNCHGRVLCQGECRCDGDYEVTEEKNGNTVQYTHRAVCRNSICVDDKTEQVVSNSQRMETQEIKAVVPQIIEEGSERAPSGEESGEATQ